MKPNILSTMLLTLFCAGSVSAQQPTKPKLVINIVISQMRADYLDRFASNFSSDGFRRRHVWAVRPVCRFLPRVVICYNKQTNRCKALI